MTSQITVGSIVTNTIFVPDSSAIISTGGGSDQSLADLLASKEDRIVTTANRVMATDPGGRPMAALVHVDELNTLQDINRDMTIQDQFDALTDVVDILDSRRFEYTWTGSEAGSVYVPMMKFPRLDNEYTGTIVIKGHASFKTSVGPVSHYTVDVDGKINVNGSSGLQHVVSMRGVWAPTENPPPFDVQVINVQVGGQQGTIYNWVCAVFDSANADFTPSRFNLLLETDMGSALLASDAPIEGAIPNVSGYDLSFVANAQIFETNATNVSLRDNALDFGTYSVEASTMTANNGLTLPYLIQVNGDPRPAIIDSFGNVSVTTEATLDDIEALPQMRTNLALLSTSIEYDADTRSLYLGKSDMADTIYISNPSSGTSQTIYLGSALDHVIIQGDTTIVESETHNVTDPYMTLNVGGTTTTGAGIRVESSGSVAAHMQLNVDGKWEAKEPDTTTYVLRDRFEALESGKLSTTGGTLTGDLSIQNPSGTSILRLGTQSSNGAIMFQGIPEPGQVWFGMLGYETKFNISLKTTHSTDSTDSEGHLKFHTGRPTNDPPERMRICKTGRVLIANSIASSDLADAQLHVRQTGSAPAFRVDDEASDTTYFLVDENGKVRVNSNTSETATETFLVNGSTRLKGDFILDDNDVTASTVPVFDASKKVISSAVTSTELGYVSGVTGPLQAQLDGKQGIVSGVDDTKIGYLTNVTSDLQAQLDGKQGIVSGVDDTKIGYLTNVTSDLQAQLDGKLSTSGGTLSNALTIGGTQAIINLSASSTNTTTGGNYINIADNNFLRFGGNGANKTQVLVVGDSFASGSGRIDLRATNSINFQTIEGPNTEDRITRMTVEGGTGNVGVGVTNPQARLHVTGGNVRIDSLTADTVPVIDSNKEIVSSAITPTKLGYLSDVTGPLQAQIDAIAESSLVTEVTLSDPSFLNISDEDALRMYKAVGNNFGSWNDFGASGPNAAVTLTYVDGTDLYISGTFTSVNGVSMSRIAKYDTLTRQWSALGSGLNSDALYLAVYNGYLYAAGQFTNVGPRVGRYDLVGSGGWEAIGVGMSSTVYSAFLDPESNSFYVGDSTITPALYRFDLTTFAKTTAGQTIGPNGLVRGLARYGDYIYACGSFGVIDGVSISRFARYDPVGNAWEAIPSGTLDNVPTAMVKAGSSLFIGGLFDTGGGVSSRLVIRYNPVADTWHTVGSNGVSGGSWVSAIGIYDESTIWIKGDFTGVNGSTISANGFVLWNHVTSEWVEVPHAATVGTTGVNTMATINNDVFLGGNATGVGHFAVLRNKIEINSSDGSQVVHEFTDDADPPVAIIPNDLLVVGDTYLNVGGATEKVLTTVQIASTDVTEFNRYYVPYSASEGSIITKYELTGTDHGKSRLTGGTFGSFGARGAVLYGGDNIYIGGWFTDVNGISGTRGIVYYNDKSKTFHALKGGGAGSGAVYSLSVIDHILIAAGFVESGFGGNASIPYIGRYDMVNKSWSLLGGAAPNSSVLNTCVVGRYLFAVGQFSDIGSLGILAMGRYDIETDTWSAVFDDLTTTSNKWITNIGVFGSDVYVTGSFDSIVVDAVDVPNTDGSAKFDVLTGTWSSQFGSTLGVIPLISYPVRGYMYAMIVNGSTGVANTTYLARYDLDNEVWEAVGGTGPNGFMNCALHVGDNIYFGGSFTSCNSVPGTAYFTRYHIPTDTFYATGLTLDDRVMNITLTPDGDMWLSGEFTEAVMLYSPNVHVYKNGVRVTTLSNDGKPSAYVINN